MLLTIQICNNFSNVADKNNQRMRQMPPQGQLSKPQYLIWWWLVKTVPHLTSPNRTSLSDLPDFGLNESHQQGDRMCRHTQTHRITLAERLFVLVYCSQPLSGCQAVSEQNNTYADHFSYGPIAEQATDDVDTSYC